MSRQNQTQRSLGAIANTIANNEICPICHGTGYIRYDLPVGHPDFGKAFPCQCRQEERAARRLQRMQRISALDLLHDMTFDTFIAEPPGLTREKAHNLRMAFDTCRDYAQHPSGWLVLSGGYGCGKTHLAAAIAHARLEQGQPALFMVAPDLLDHLRSTFAPNSETSYDQLFEELKSTPLLILDDLGAQSNTAWAQEKFFQLLNYRYTAQLPTAITTNQRIEDMDPRLRSRLLDIRLVHLFPILAPDFRSDRELVASSDLSTLALHREQTFASFTPRRSDLSSEARANLEEVFAICRKFAQQMQGWLVLSGTYGCGKTHLAAAIANQLAEAVGAEVMFVVTPDLLDYLRAAYNPQSTTSYDRRFDEIKRVALLVLDDLGTESATPWAREKLFQLLNYRYNANLPTVITTSSTPEQIDPWLRTRMFDLNRCQYCAILASGYRGSPSQKQAKTAPRIRQARS